MVDFEKCDVQSISIQDADAAASPYLYAVAAS
jgi:hypothetical protein